MPVQLLVIANVETQRRRNSYLSLRTAPRYVASHSLQITRSFFVLLMKAVIDCFRIVTACDYDLRGEKCFCGPELITFEVTAVPVSDCQLRFSY